MLQLLPNWVTTYLLAVLLTLMALRLYSKGKQAYAKETQLLLAAKAASKERAQERHRSITHSRRPPPPSSSHPGEAAQRAGSAATEAVHVPGAQRKLDQAQSYASTLGRSLSRSSLRLRSGSLLVSVDPSILSPVSGAAGASTGGLLMQSTGARSRRWPSTTSTPDVAGGAHNRREGARAQDQNQALPSPALEQYMCSTLFQVTGVANTVRLNATAGAVLPSCTRVVVIGVFLQVCACKGHLWAACYVHGRLASVMQD